MTLTKQSIKAVLFDLDGTLLDTAGDLGSALNAILSARHLPLITTDRVRPHAGRGCKGLLKFGMNIDDSHPEYSALCEELLNHYQTQCLNTTNLFSGMESVLDHLDNKQIPWGIVTNKPHRFTIELVNHLHLAKRTHCIISGDTLTQRKPHPEPIIHACDLLSVHPGECLYVGDSEIDIIASKAAGTASLVAMYGYIPKEESPELWKADGYIQHPTEIMQWVE